MAIVARFSGKCSKCGGAIAVGQGIERNYISGKQVWVHDVCETANLATRTIQYTPKTNKMAVGKTFQIGTEWALVGFEDSFGFHQCGYILVDRVLVCGRIQFVSETGDVYTSNISQEYSDGEFAVITPA